MDIIIPIALVGVIIVIIVIMVLTLRRYIKVPPDTMLVVYGSRFITQERDNKTGEIRIVARGYKVLIGGGQFIMPFIMDYKMMSLKPYNIDMNVNGIITKSGGYATCVLSAQVRINKERESLYKAAEHFLQRTEQEIKETISKTLEIHTRKVCSNLDINEARAELDKIASKIREAAEKSFEEMGLEIVSFCVKDIRKQ